jgi:hypothetical protein
MITAHETPVSAEIGACLLPVDTTVVELVVAAADLGLDLLLVVVVVAVVVDTAPEAPLATKDVTTTYAIDVHLHRKER